jgi:hypothetical protein
MAIFCSIANDDDNDGAAVASDVAITFGAVAVAAVVDIAAAAGRIALNLSLSGICLGKLAAEGEGTNGCFGLEDGMADP